MILRRFLIALGTFAFAHTAAAQNLIDATDEKLIAQFMQDEGFRAKLEVLDDGDPVIRSNSSGTRFSIYFYGCDRGTSCKTLTFFVAFDLPDGLTLHQMNDYNMQLRFGRLYLDEEMDPFLELDVNLRHGITQENLADTLEIWLEVMGDLEHYIDNRDRG